VGWTKAATGTTETIRGIWGSAASDIWATGGAELHFNGTAWAVQDVTAVNSGRGVWGSGASDVWVVGQGGLAAHYNGKDWTGATLGTSETIGAIWGRSPTEIWVVGDEGQFRSYSGGVWNAVASGTARHLYHVWGVGTEIYLVGAGGAILSQSGKQAVVPAPGTMNVSAAHLGALWGTSSSDIWAAGSGGTIMHWNGLKWQVEVVGSEAFNALWGSGQSDVWAVGDKGTVVHFDGTSWKVSVVPSLTGDLASIHGSGPSDVWIVGSAGTPAHWDGAQWKLSPALGAALEAVWAVSTSEAWASGASGTIARFDGQAWKASGPTPALTSRVRGIAGEGKYLWFVGDSGSLVEYDGAVWTTSDLGTATLRSIGVKGEQRWIYADINEVWIYQAKSKAWSKTSISGMIATRLFGFAENDLWACGVYGAVQHYNHSGVTPKVP
jgi:hypothetical protein